MGRGGRKAENTEPERRCIVSGDSQPRCGLIRFALSPEGEIVPDLLGKLPGRGFWVAADRERLLKAADGPAFARAARRAVKLPPDLVVIVEQGLAARVTGLLAMARKAGQAVAGYEKVKSWLEDGTAVVLFQAADGSERGRAKLRPPDGEGSLFTVLTADELGQAFGREKTIHGALAAGGLTNRVVEEAARLAGVRAPNRGESASGRDKTA